MAGLPSAIIKKYGVSKKAWEIFRGRGGRSNTRRRASRPRRPRRPSYSGGNSMARRKSRSRNSGFSAGGIFSQRNILGTVGGAYAGRALGMNPQLGAAAGSYLYGKKGVLGAGIGYIAGPMALSLIDKLMAGFGSSTSGGSSW